MDTTAQPKSMLPKDIIELGSEPETSTKEKMISAYNNFSSNYDKDMQKGGWSAHVGTSKEFHEYAQKYFPGKEKEIRIIDVGCGTGFVAERLQKFGYTNIDGIDASQNMLEQAKKKNLYQNLICSYVTNERQDKIADGSYDCVVSSGAFAAGYIKADAILEVLRWTKKGGLICFTLRKDAYDNQEFGYTEKFAELERDKKWQQLSDTKNDNFVHERVNEYSNRYNHVLVYRVL